MPFYRRIAARYFLSSLVALCSVIDQAAADIGETIYQQGKTLSGQVTIGDDPAGNHQNKAPSVLFACTNCHGERAQGKQETGVIAPNITWSQLAQPYRRDIKGGKSRMPYNFQSFKAALLDGIDSDGNRLSGGMPRYFLSDQELTSLADYLQGIATASYQGVTDAEIEIRLLPPSDPELADALRQTVAGFIAPLNNQGGIFRRKLKITESVAATSRSFCVVDLRTKLVSEASDNGIILSIFSRPQSSQNGYALYPHPSDYHQLKIAAASKNGWYPLSVENQTVAQLLGRLREQDNTAVGSTALIHKSGDTDVSLLIEALQAVDLYPIILTDSQALTGASGRSASDYPGAIFTVSPPGPESVSSDGQKELIALANSLDNPLSFGKNLSMRLWTLALMKLLSSSLQQAGHDLTPLTFSKALQRQVDLDTGFGPVLSFSPGRRIGNSDVILSRIN